MAFAGMDIGTSGCKLVVYDLEGNVIYQEAQTYQESGDGGLRELDGNMVLHAAFKVLEDTGRNCPEPVEAIAFTSLGESVVCMNAEGEILAYSLLTGDPRGITESEELIEKFGQARIFDITGLPPNELYGLPKYIWLNRNTDAIQSAHSIFFYEDLLGYVLTGERKVSYSSAARSMAFDITAKKWSRELLAEAGIRIEQMSRPVPPCSVIGTILPEMAAKLHLYPEMQVVVGGHDQTCAAVGSGLLDRSTGECGMGTCEFLFLMLPHKATDSYMLENDFTCIPHVLSKQYLTSLEVTTCGALKNWARNTVLGAVDLACRKKDINFFAYMDEMAENTETEVLVLPQFGSRGTPDLSMDAWGTITGLTIHTRPEEIYRGILEGMAFQMYLSYERLKCLGVEISDMVATGGGSASELTMQIRADVFGVKVHTLETREAGTLGCMIMAAVGVGAYECIQDGIKQAVKRKKTFIPDTAKRDYYSRKFKKYKKLYQLMNDFKQEAEE